MAYRHQRPPPPCWATIRQRSPPPRASTAALAALPRERRTHHLIDTADSALAAGHTSLALEMLLRAEQTSPQEARSLPAARAVIAGLARARRGPTGQSELRELARRAGVAA
jgi:hypothetical protein